MSDPVLVVGYAARYGDGAEQRRDDLPENRTSPILYRLNHTTSTTVSAPLMTVIPVPQLEARE